MSLLFGALNDTTYFYDLLYGDNCVGTYITLDGICKPGQDFKYASFT